jgi:Uma2 family endonuclease
VRHRSNSSVAESSAICHDTLSKLQREEAGMSTARHKLFTFDDFCAMVHDDQKADLIAGVIYMASPENTDANERFMWLAAILEFFVRMKKLGRMFGSRVAFRIDETNGPEPDLAFVATARLHLVRRGRVDGPPDLAIEIVSPESVARDWISKRQQYEQAGVIEYWIIDEIKSTVTLLRLGRDLKYKEVRPRKGVLESKVIAGFWLRPAWLWQDKLPDPDEVLREILAGTPRP